MATVIDTRTSIASLAHDELVSVEKPARRGAGPKIGLVLGSGAARGWAHIGVIRALEAKGFAPGDDVEIGGTVFELDPQP